MVDKEEKGTNGMGRRGGWGGGGGGRKEREEEEEEEEDLVMMLLMGGRMGLREAERKGTSVPTTPTDATTNVDGDASITVVPSITVLLLVVVVVVVVVFGRVEHLESGQSVVEHVKAIYDQSQNRKRKERSILVALGREDVYLGS
ncbi:hypothetical protein M0802_005784 [Mischocyttarus mexicanus]|nr:hypothetical protein M0802_005784 [Mischocyttarus mexicanus]